MAETKKATVVKKPTTKPAVKKPAAPKATTTAKQSSSAKPAAPKATTTAKQSSSVKLATSKTLKAKTALPKEVFGVKVNKQAIFDVILSERASRRQGTHKVKGKGEVAGSGIKPWKQKGTGRARAGYKQSPVWVGGARAFGPKPERNYTLTINKKVRKLALTSALTLKAKDSSVFVSEVKVTKFSTKQIVKFVDTIDMKPKQRKVLIVTENNKVFKSASNIQNVETVKLNSISVEKIVDADVVVFSDQQIKKLVEVMK